MSKYKGKHCGKKGQKIWARPSPPLFGQCPKENIFFFRRASLTQLSCNVKIPVGANNTEGSCLAPKINLCNRLARKQRPRSLKRMLSLQIAQMVKRFSPGWATPFSPPLVWSLFFCWLPDCWVVECTVPRSCNRQLTWQSIVLSRLFSHLCSWAMLFRSLTPFGFYRPPLIFVSGLKLVTHFSLQMVKGDFPSKTSHFKCSWTRVTVYLTELNFAKELGSIEQLVSSINLATDIVASVDSWWPQYRTFVEDQLGQDLPSSEGDWTESLVQFLFR